MRAAAIALGVFGLAIVSLTGPVSDAAACSEHDSGGGQSEAATSAGAGRDAGPRSTAAANKGTKNAGSAGSSRQSASKNDSGALCSTGNSPTGACRRA